MKEIKAYQCDYCRKYSKSKSAMSRHERECYHNPLTRACATCQHLHQIEVPIDVFPVFRSKPICEKGIEVTIQESSQPYDFKVSLKHHCPLWEQRIIEEED